MRPRSAAGLLQILLRHDQHQQAMSSGSGGGSGGDGSSSILNQQQASSLLRSAYRAARTQQPVQQQRPVALVLGRSSSDSGSLRLRQTGIRCLSDADATESVAHRATLAAFADLPQPSSNSCCSASNNNNSSSNNNNNNNCFCKATSSCRTSSSRGWR
jgi:hypothetical protein